MYPNKPNKDKKKPFDTDIRNFDSKKQITKSRKVNNRCYKADLGYSQR